MIKTALCIAWSLVIPKAFEALKYLQALHSYNSDIQVHLLNSEIRQVVHHDHSHKVEIDNIITQFAYNK